MDGVLMRRKGLERRSKKYAPVQNVSVGNWYMDAEDFHQKYKTGRIGVKKRMSPAAGGKNRIMNWILRSSAERLRLSRRCIAAFA